MKLHEEFKEYETLWEEVEETKVLKENSDSSEELIDKALEGIADFELEYDGWTDHDAKDHFGWNGHYQTTTHINYPEFTYEVEVAEMYEDMRDVLLVKYADKHMKNALVQEWQRLYAAYETASDEEKVAAEEAIDIFVADNLEDLFIELYNDILSYYKDRAYEWAHEFIEPCDD